MIYEDIGPCLAVVRIHIRIIQMGFNLIVVDNPLPRVSLDGVILHGGAQQKYIKDSTFRLIRKGSFNS